MILVARELIFTDCSVENISIQMGLLKSIKYSMFEVSALNGLVDENRLSKEENEHFRG